MIGKRETDLGTVTKEHGEVLLLERQVITTGQPAASSEESHALPDGTVRWFSTVRVPVRDADGKVQQALTVASDITAYKSAVDEQKRLVTELQSSMKFKDQILATMSHELRTPLNAIMGFAGIGLMDEDLPENIEMMLDRIDYNARRLLTLINAILDISRLNAGRVDILWQPADVRELADVWRKDFAIRIAEKKLEFVYDISPDFPAKLEADPERLTQVAVNLLSNAVKFTEKGKITLAIRSTAENWIIEVADTGIGISETWQEQIFEEFRQVTTGATSKYGGSGLGLAIVQKLCGLMNGTIRVKSEVGVGSTFTATFALRPVKTAETPSDKDVM
jgi:two-component system, sensor histidine kinase and response regulator